MICRPTSATPLTGTIQPAMGVRDVGKVHLENSDKVATPQVSRDRENSLATPHPKSAVVVRYLNPSARLMRIAHIPHSGNAMPSIPMTASLLGATVMMGGCDEVRAQDVPFIVMTLSIFSFLISYSLVLALRGPIFDLMDKFLETRKHAAEQNARVKIERMRIEAEQTKSSKSGMFQKLWSALPEFRIPSRTEREIKRLQQQIELERQKLELEKQLAQIEEERDRVSERRLLQNSQNTTTVLKALE